MTRPLLMLAAHGAGDDSPANQLLHKLEASVAAALPDCDVEAAFNLGAPNYTAVLRDHPAQSITIVPVMISDGYFRNVVLPRAIQQAELAADRVTKITDPVGHHPRMADLLSDQVRAAFTLLGSSEVPVLIVGHGTERNPESSRSTLAACDVLRERGIGSEVVAAFLDQAPRLEAVASQITASDFVVAPFLLGGGDHTLTDIPERIGVTLPVDTRLPACLPRGEYRAVIAAPVGDHPGLAELIIETARNELRT